MKLRIVGWLLMLLVAQSAYAWDATGHRIIAQVAYDHLTPSARKHVDALTYEPGKQFPGYSRFMYIATWADVARARGDTRFAKWHYINLPITANGVRALPVDQDNVVHGVQKSFARLKNPYNSEGLHKLYLKLLVHLVADAHQPLHAVARYSKRYPRGDHGGHGYKIKHDLGNLHVFWDQGLGDFRRFGSRYPLRFRDAKRAARHIEHAYPRAVFADSQIQAAPIEWVHEGQRIAKRFVYRTPEGKKPKRAYVRKGRKLVEKRVALAGYRLADQLNRIYGY